MTTSTAVRPETFEAAIEELGRLLGPGRRRPSREDLERLSGVFVGFALEDYETAMQEIARRGLPQTGRHALRMYMGGEDGVVWTGRESVDMGPSQVRLISGSTVNERHTELVVTIVPVLLREVPTPKEVEWREFTVLLGKEPSTKKHIVIEFDSGDITSVHWEYNEKFGTR